MDCFVCECRRSEVKSIRDAKGLSLREFAKEFKEDHTLLGRIERGQRYPPRPRLERFASALSLTTKQLDALISVERRGLNPYELLPEIPAAHISDESIEKAAENVLEKYRRATNRSEVEIPVQVEIVLDRACGLSTEYADFKKKKIPQSLYGCLYPDGFGSRDRVAFVNTGLIRGRRLSPEDRRTTLAHEGGHFILHCGNKESKQLFFRFKQEPTFCREAQCEDALLNPLEYQASVFAACLLMPRKQFRAAWQGQSGAVSEVANHFGVTVAFARFRAKMLNCE